MKTKKLWLTPLAAIFLITGYMVSCKDDFSEIIVECPEVVSTNPANMAGHVSLEQVITVIFNVEMDPATLTQASFILQEEGGDPKSLKAFDISSDRINSKPNESFANTKAQSTEQAFTPIAGTVTYSGLIATFTPSNPLTSNRTYTGTIVGTVKDLMGNFLQTDYVWTFSTDATTSPTVISTDPVNLATNVDLDKTISANFNEAMDPATITASTFTLMDGATPVPGAVGYSGITATLKPTDDLELGKTYTANITTGVDNKAGTAMADNYVWTFSTGATIAPTVISTDPVNLATNVDLDKTISANFNEAMDPATITASTFTLMDEATPVPGTVGYSGMMATLKPINDLEPGKTYTVNITTGVENEAGTAMADNYVWTFSTGAATAPTVISTDPVDLAIDVLYDKIIRANFSTEMNPLTITASTLTFTFTAPTFTLTDGDAPINGSIHYSGTTASFTPFSDLPAGKTFIATITTGVENEAGTALAENYVWSFTSQYSLVVHAVNGTVNIDKEQSGYNFEDLVELTPTPADGYSFDSWSGDAAGNDNPLTVIMDENKVITANFTEIRAIDLGVIDLGTGGDLAVLTKSGISTVGATIIADHIGISPAIGNAFTGFSQTMYAGGEVATSDYVAGRMYVSDYANPTPDYVNTAISDQGTALTAAMSLTTDVIVDLCAGDISGMTLAPGLYKWGTGLLTASQGVTLEGGTNDTWVLQIPDDFTIENDAAITLAGGVLPENIFRVTSTQALFVSDVEFFGNVLPQTQISLTNGTTDYGRLLSQTAVTLDASTVTKP